MPMANFFMVDPAPFGGGGIRVSGWWGHAAASFQLLNTAKSKERRAKSEEGPTGQPAGRSPVIPARGGGPLHQQRWWGSPAGANQAGHEHSLARKKLDFESKPESNPCTYHVSRITYQRTTYHYPVGACQPKGGAPANHGK